MDEFKFSPENGFLNTTSYPDPANQTATRTQFQSLHNQTRDFINNKLIPAIEKDTTALNGHTVGKNVPIDAVFTDTVYDDSSLKSRISSLESTISLLESRIQALETKESTSS